MNTLREDGQWAVDLDDRKEVVDALRELTTQHEAGVEYKNACYTAETENEDYALIVAAVHTLFPDGDLTVARMAAALRLLMDSGQIKRKDLEPVALLEEPKIDDTPKDKNGTPLNESQLRYREYREWSERASASEVNLRKRSDPGYMSYVRKALTAEMTSTPVGDAVTPEGQVVAPVSRSSEPLTPQLREFARKYAKEPIANLRPKGGFVTLDGQQMSWAYFQDLLNAATAAGAIA